jgi:cytochrome c-type biogenesis protein CcmH/NrfG
MLRQAEASRDADAMLRAGAFALQAGIPAEAVAPVERALRNHKGNARLWQLLGLLYRDLEDLAPSVEAFAMAAERAPEDAMIAHGRACVCYEAGLPAVSLFERAMRLAPSDRSIMLRHAAALIAEDKGDAAIAVLEQELARNPTWREAHAALARVRWTRGEKENFADSFERALLAAPRAPELWGGYVEALLQAQLHARALDVIQRARSAVGSQRMLDATEAVARFELGEAEAAEALFARIVNTEDVAIIVPYLRFLLLAGRVQEVADLAGKLAPRDRTNQMWPYLSVAWRLLGDPRWEWLEGDPRFIGVYDIADSLPPLDSLGESLRALHQTIHQPLAQSVRGGTQTENHLFQRVEPEFRALRQAVVAAVEKHVAQLPAPQPGHPLLIERRAPIGFAGSWSVRLTGGGHHSEHVHPAGWLSSALYISLPGEAERGTAEAGWLSLGEVNQHGPALPPIRTVEPKPGRLVLFPATMWHGTRPFEAGERLTVAFDVRRPG